MDIAHGNMFTVWHLVDLFVLTGCGEVDPGAIAKRGGSPPRLKLPPQSLLYRARTERSEWRDVDIRLAELIAKDADLGRIGNELAFGKKIERNRYTYGFVVSPSWPSVPTALYQCAYKVEAKPNRDLTMLSLACLWMYLDDHPGLSVAIEAPWGVPESEIIGLGDFPVTWWMSE